MNLSKSGLKKGKLIFQGNDTDWSQELSTRKSVSNISIGRERVEEKKTENGDVPVKRKGGKTPEGKKKKKKHG